MDSPYLPGSHISSINVNFHKRDLVETKYFAGSMPLLSDNHSPNSGGMSYDYKMFMPINEQVCIRMSMWYAITLNVICRYIVLVWWCHYFCIRKRSSCISWIIEDGCQFMLHLRSEMESVCGWNNESRHWKVLIVVVRYDGGCSWGFQTS